APAAGGDLQERTSTQEHLLYQTVHTTNAEGEEVDEWDFLLRNVVKFAYLTFQTAYLRLAEAGTPSRGGFPTEDGLLKAAGGATDSSAAAAGLGERPDELMQRGASRGGLGDHGDTATAALRTGQEDNSTTDAGTARM
ncbi:unnamed protein product, partial [Amoebophrya sp. A120]